MVNPWFKKPRSIGEKVTGLDDEVRKGWGQEAEKDRLSGYKHENYVLSSVKTRGKSIKYRQLGARAGGHAG